MWKKCVFSNLSVIEILCLLQFQFISFTDRHIGTLTPCIEAVA